MPKLINLEGLDGAGKSTLIQKIKEYFRENNLPLKTIHFPTTQSNSKYGQLIKSYLNGDLGDLCPYAATFLFAQDRKVNKEKINNWLNEGYYVLLDRYIYSNIAYQSAKAGIELDDFLDWSYTFEFHINGIPRPDIVLYLDTPMKEIKKRLSNKKRDKYEKDISFLQQVQKSYLELENRLDSFKIIGTTDGSGLLSADIISKTFIETLKNTNNL